MKTELDNNGEPIEYKVLSLDVWGNKKDGFDVNQWYGTGLTFKPCQTKNNKSILRVARSLGLLKAYTQYTVDDDGYNFVIIHKASQTPCFWIEYGIYN